MIVRARSPLFIFHVLGSVLTLLGIGIILDIREGRESFLTDPRIQSLRDILIVSCTLGLVIMAALGAMEYAIHKGWDPQFLKVRLYGAQILRIERPPLNSDLWTVVVIHPDGAEHSYLGEEDEIKGMKPGDYYRLDVFGQHIVGIRVLEKAKITDPNAQKIRPSTSVPWTDETKRHGGAWMLMILMFPVSGFMIGKNLLPLIFREDMIYISGRRGRSGTLELLQGDTAIWANVPFVAVGLACIIAGIYYWVAGWDQEELSYHLSEAGDEFSRKSSWPDRIWRRW